MGRSAYAVKQKEAGNAAVAAQDWATAVDRYASGINFVEFNGGGGGGGGHSHGGRPCSGHHGGDDGNDLELGDETRNCLLRSSAIPPWLDSRWESRIWQQLIVPGHWR